MNKKIISILFFLTYLLLGLRLLKDYGINWDEPEHFIRGQTFLNYFLGKKDFSFLPVLDFKSYQLNWGYLLKKENSEQTVRRSIYQQHYFGWYLKKVKLRVGHPPFADNLAALSNYLFFIKLGIAPDVDSYNYVPVFLSAVLVAAVFYWVSNIWGAFAGLVAALSLGLYPLFLGERHFNIKDVPQTVFFALALMMFFEAATRMSKKYLVLFIAFASMAFATKLNFGFAIFIIFPWLGLLFLQGWRPHFKKHKLFWLLFLTTPLVMISFLILTWPAIWFLPKEYLKEILLYYKEIGTTVQRGFPLYALKYILFTTPVVILVLSSLSLLTQGLFSKKQRLAFSLVLIWFLVPVIRVSLPKTNIYGGVRQIMEYVPALAILAGVGAAGLQGRLMRFKPTKLWSMALVLLFAPTLVKMVQIHPNESVFFNSLIGGLKGAKEHKIPDAGQSLGNPYRQGIKWINENAETGAKLAFGYEMMANIPHIWVRNDIKFTNLNRSGPAKEGEYLMSVIDDQSANYYTYDMRYLEKTMQPVYELKVEGIPLLKIWKNDKLNTKQEFLSEELVKGAELVKKEAYLSIVLPEACLLTRLEFEVPPKDFSGCLNLPDDLGIFDLITGEKLEKTVRLPVIHKDYGQKLRYPEPFLNLAAEEAKIINYYYPKDKASCFDKVNGIKAYRLPIKKHE